VPMTDCVLEIIPGCPTLPVIVAIARASEAVLSKALYTSGLSSGFDFAKAECSKGCVSPATDPTPFNSIGEILRPRFLLGDVDIVVTVVVAVGGLSVEACDTAAPEVAGNFPVNSSFLIRDLRSSSSSQTVDGAVVEVVDSVPSGIRGVSGSSSTELFLPTSGEELYVLAVE
jgi:hypothetical protein